VASTSNRQEASASAGTRRAIAHSRLPFSTNVPRESLVAEAPTTSSGSGREPRMFIQRTLTPSTGLPARLMEPVTPGTVHTRVGTHASSLNTKTAQAARWVTRTTTPLPVRITPCYPDQSSRVCQTRRARQTQDDLLDGALRKAARPAVRQHWAAGFPVAEWRNGRVVWVGPDGRVSDRPYRVRKRSVPSGSVDGGSLCRARHLFGPALPPPAFEVARRQTNQRVRK
jgi:hypothetical protein